MVPNTRMIRTVYISISTVSSELTGACMLGAHDAVELLPWPFKQPPPASGRIYHPCCMRKIDKRSNSEKKVANVGCLRMCCYLTTHLACMCCFAIYIVRWNIKDQPQKRTANPSEDLLRLILYHICGFQVNNVAHLNF